MNIYSFGGGENIGIFHHRKGYFHIFSHILYDHMAKNEPKYYLALVEEKFFRMLKIMLSSVVERKGEALTVPTTALIPTIINIEKAMEDKVRVNKLLTEYKIYS